MRAPDFWQIRHGRDAAPMLRLLLSPFSWVQGFFTARRLARTVPVPMPVPVVAIGNLSLGGTGKTPLARLVRATLSSLAGGPVAIVSRGHGGSHTGPLAVDPDRHDAAIVGDEPLMLAADGPVVIGRERAAAARLAVQQGAAALVLDDAHQNPAVARDLSICVIDAQAGFGNGYLFPAGPLREKPDVGLARADAVILMGHGTPDEEVQAALDHWGGPVFRARLEPVEACHDLSGAGPLLGFCGIGRPAKFEDTLRACKADLIDLVPFDDHHPYMPAELERLARLAAERGAGLVTTEKDFARLPAAFRPQVRVLRVSAVMAEPDRFGHLLGSVLKPVPQGVQP
jgi:tetraacyldisaccharide 4'-kinase